MTVSRVFVWTLWAANVTMATVSLVLVGAETAVLTTIVFGFSSVGALVASRHPANPIGWTFCLTGSAAGIQALALAYALDSLGNGAMTPGVVVAAWVQEWMWIPLIGLPTVVVPPLFPDGRLPSPRWRVVLWAGILTMTVGVFGFALKTGPLANDPRLAGLTNPFGVSPGAEVVGLIGFVLMLATAALAIASLVVRYRRAGGDQRQQIKWFAYGGSIMGLLVVVGSALWQVSPIARQVVPFSLLLGPTGAGIGILRYRLYDIDRIINLTLVYSVLSGLLGAVYVGSVFLLGGVGSALGSDDTLGVAASVLVVAALFHPARRRLQATIDRRFYRSKYDAARTVELFARRLVEQADLETVGDDLVALTSSTMRPSHVSLWLRDPG
ncbi:MAG: hypothetical protein WD156_03775 [Acidimicrobiia bacterium]